MRGPGAAVLLLALAAAPLGAQVRGVPVPGGGAPDGVAGSLDMAFPGEGLGSGTAWAASVSLRRGRFAAAGTYLLVNHVAEPARSGLGLRAEATLVRSATSPFQLLAFAGAGTVGFGDAGREWRIPAGVSFAFRAPNPVATLVPWLSARAQWIDAASDGDVYAGIGGGIDVTAWRHHVSFRAAYDRVLRPGDDEATFGLGLTYTFTSRF